MKKILHLTHTCVPNDARILRELGALGVVPDAQVHAFGVRETGPTSRRSAYTLREFKLLSTRATWLPRPLRYSLLSLEINARFLRHILRLRPDIVHCHDTMVLPSGAVAKALSHSTLVYDAHELESDKAGQGHALSLATLWIEKACWSSIDALITVSPSIVEWYQRHFEKRPTLCLLNSPEIARLATSAASVPGQLRNTLGIGKDVPLFIYVGALETGRGIELLLRTFTTGDAEAHIAFIGDGRLKGKIQQTGRAHPNVRHCEPVPHDSLVSFIEDADGAFCLIEDVSLSDHYCMPNKLFEYAFAGVPVVASKLPDIDATVSHYELGATTDLNEESVREAMTACLMMGRGRSTEHLHDLSWSTQAENLRQLYRTL